MCSIIDTNDITSKSYSDQTRNFPVKLSRGDQYIFILYHFDTNTIHDVPLKNKHSYSITQAWLECYALLNHYGEAPTLHILDNECSQDLKDAFLNEQVKFQLVPPHVHQKNATKRASRKYKNHLIAGLCTCDSRFPVREWDRLLLQASLTINLIRYS